MKAVESNGKGIGEYAIEPLFLNSARENGRQLFHFRLILNHLVCTAKLGKSFIKPGDCLKLLCSVSYTTWMQNQSYGIAK